MLFALLLVLGMQRSVAAAGEPPAQTALPPIGPDTSLLVVAPHPDDESLCCAGAIRRVLAARGSVSVVWITSGDASELDLLLIERSLLRNPRKLRQLGVTRMQEARAATLTLGVAADQQLFLGYPDRGLLAIETDNYVTPYRSKYTDTASVPYAGTVFPGHPYTGRSLEHDFDAVLDRVQPTIVLAPSPRDLHPDHRASGVLTLRAMSRRGQLQRVRYWIVHGGHQWPTPRGYEPNLALTPAPASAGLAPQPFALEAAEEERKLIALRAYHTQMAVMASILLSYVRANELYSALPVPDPNQPSH